MNIGEAHDINRVLKHLLAGLRGEPEGEVPAVNEARAAAARLADRAHKTLMAGMTGRDVLDQMPAHCGHRHPDGNRWCYQPVGHDGLHDDMDMMWPGDGGDASC